MKCEYCNNDLRVASSKMESEVGTAAVTCVQKLVCVNPYCEIYAGKDLTNPLHIALTKKSEVSNGV